jgi:hypothetical protein
VYTWHTADTPTFDESLGEQAVFQVLECIAAQREARDDWEAGAAEAVKRLGLEDNERIKQIVAAQLDRLKYDYDEYEATGA